MSGMVALADPTPRPAPSGLKVGGYELLSRIAAGGMGEVFIARKTGSGAFEKRVALKLLLPHLTDQPDAVRMFLDEARIAARMNHPHIVQIFDLGEADGRMFIAMALVEGTTLSKLLKACRREQMSLPLPMVRLIASGLCEGLSYAHGLRGPNGEDFSTVHRDATPSNLLLSRGGAVLLTDFGIAKAQGNLHATRTGHVLGKYAYMAPEQLSGKRVDARADVYSVAITVFEALTGVCPFQRATDPETIDAVRAGAVLDVCALRPEVSPTMADALRRGTAFSPEGRPPTVSALLEGLLDGPVARSSELGEWVETLCAQQLEPFQVSAEVPDGVTRTHGAKAAAAPPPAAEASATSSLKRRWVRVLGAAGVALVALGVVAGWRTLGRAQVEERTSAVSTAGVVVSQPPPEPEVPPRVTAAEVQDTPPAPSPEAPPTRPGAAAPEPGARRSTARVAMGYLSADAEPWASVWTGGRQLERTPFSRYPLPVGRHVLVFKNSDLGKEVRRVVYIRAGRVKTLRVRFQP